MENRHRIWIIVIFVFSFNLLIVNELTAERQWIAKAVKLIKNLHFKGVLTLKFGSKDLLLWKSLSDIANAPYSAGSSDGKPCPDSQNIVYKCFFSL